jgi:hypothetical protein
MHSVPSSTPVGGDSCPACGQEALADWRRVRASDSRARQSTYLLRRCRNCGTAVTSGRTSGEDAPLYRGGAYAEPPAATETVVEPLRKLGERSRLRALGPIAPGSRVFEVGAGDGRLLSALERRGHTVAGTEPYARSHHPSVAAIGVEELTLEPGAYDLIILWHVLEHLADPFAAVRRLEPALSPAGRLVVAVPNLDSLQARLGGSAWFHLDVPRHAVHFTRAGLTALLERAGLRVSRVRTASLDQNLVGMTQTLITRLTRRADLGFGTLKEPRPRPGDVALAAAVAIPAIPVAIAAEAVAVAAGRGGSLVVHAVRAS